jgi:hypothetical protein
MMLSTNSTVLSVDDGPLALHMSHCPPRYRTLCALMRPRGWRQAPTDMPRTGSSPLRCHSNGSYFQAVTIESGLRERGYRSNKKKMFTQCMWFRSMGCKPANMHASLQEKPVGLHLSNTDTQCIQFVRPEWMDISEITSLHLCH